MTHTMDMPSTDSAGRSFQWLRLLGRGGFGEVYLARMRSSGGLEQQVAVKLLQPGLDPASQAVERLRDEARLLASLHHPVILSAHDLVMLGERVALVTEFIEGQDLSACIRGSDRMPPSTLLEVVEAVAGALDTVFLQHVVHRDIKPSNIRVGMHGNVKLLDFGIARSGLTDREARTQSQAVVGTLRYMAPERLVRDAEPEPSSDVFALGAVLYEGLAQQGLLEPLDLTKQVRLSVQPELWSELLEERLQTVQPSDQVPEGLRALLREMLAHDKTARPTASEVAERCERLAAQVAQPVRLARWCRNRRWPGGTKEAGDPPHSTLWQPNAPPDRTPTVQALPSSPPGTPSTSALRPPLLLAGGVAVTTLLSGAVGIGGVAVVLLVLVLGLSYPSQQAPSSTPAPPPPADPVPAAPAPVELAPEPAAPVSPRSRADERAEELPAPAPLPSPVVEIVPEPVSEREPVRLALRPPAGGVGGTVCHGEITAQGRVSLACVEPYRGAAAVALQPYLSEPAPVEVTFTGPSESAAPSLPGPHAVDELEGWPSLPFGSRFVASMRVRDQDKGVTYVDPNDELFEYLDMTVSMIQVHFVGGKANAVSMTAPADAEAALRARWGPPTSAEGNRLEWRGARVSVQLHSRKLTVRRT